MSNFESLKSFFGLTGPAVAPSADALGADVALLEATTATAAAFVPCIQRAKVIKVYDGDTLTVAGRLVVDGRPSLSIYKFQVRLRGIDTPELKTKNAKEKELATRARDALASYVLNAVVTLQNIEYDKYGRLLADVVASDGQNLSGWMLENKFAVAYDGGTKAVPAEWRSDDNDLLLM
jgi:endonuclease YncB( thermonuclease family)